MTSSNKNGRSKLLGPPWVSSSSSTSSNGSDTAPTRARVASRPFHLAMDFPDEIKGWVWVWVWVGGFKGGKKGELRFGDQPFGFIPPCVYVCVCVCVLQKDSEKQPRPPPLVLFDVPIVISRLTFDFRCADTPSNGFLKHPSGRFRIGLQESLGWVNIIRRKGGKGEGGEGGENPEKKRKEGRRERRAEGFRCIRVIWASE